MGKQTAAAPRLIKEEIQSFEVGLMGKSYSVLFGRLNLYITGDDQPSMEPAASAPSVAEIGEIVN